MFDSGMPSSAAVAAAEATRGVELMMAAGVAIIAAMSTITSVRKTFTTMYCPQVISGEEPAQLYIPTNN
jgi:hypothetical protein